MSEAEAASEPVGQLTAARFEEQLNKTFHIHLDDATLEAKLVQVDRVNSHTQREDKVPFSILFEGPLDMALPQHTYKVKNDGMGEMLLFLVTIGPDSAGQAMIYEAVFT